jgi:hypothetical protein
MYAVADVNKLFYDEHGLESIKELVYRSDLSIEEDLLISSFSQSKTYSALLLDERHFSNQSDKYVRNGLLGQPGSFTRAMALGDEAGMLRYRSSYNHAYLNRGVIEYDSVEGVPLLDMFEKVNYSRLNFWEKTAM